MEANQKLAARGDLNHHPCEFVTVWHDPEVRTRHRGYQKGLCADSFWRFPDWTI